MCDFSWANGSFIDLTKDRSGNSLLVQGSLHPSIDKEFCSRLDKGVLLLQAGHMSQGTYNAETVCCLCNSTVCLLDCCCFLYLKRVS